MSAVFRILSMSDSMLRGKYGCTDVYVCTCVFKFFLLFLNFLRLYSLLLQFYLLSNNDYLLRHVCVCRGGRGDSYVVSSHSTQLQYRYDTATYKYKISYEITLFDSFHSIIMTPSLPFHSIHLI